MKKLPVKSSDKNYKPIKLYTLKKHQHL